MDWYLNLTFLLVALGAILLAAEFFLPTGGFLVVFGVLALTVAVGIAFLYGSSWEAFGVILAVCVGGPIAGWQLVAAYEKRVAAPLLESETVTTTLGNLPEITELDKLRGRYGKAITPMRPAGAVEIDGHRYDAQSEGLMIDAGTRIKCVAVRSGKVIVREAEPAGDLSDMSINGLG